MKVCQPSFSAPLRYPDLTEYFMIVESIFHTKCFNAVIFGVEQSVLHENIYNQGGRGDSVLQPKKSGLNPVKMLFSRIRNLWQKCSSLASTS